MPKAMEIIGGSATAPSTTFTALTAFSGNSFTVRNAPVNARLLAVWNQNQTAGQIRVRSPRMHDNVQGLRLEAQAAPVNLPNRRLYQDLYPQDALTVEMTGSGTAGDIEQGFLQIYYPDLPGVSANLIDAAELSKRGVNTIGVENTISTGTSGGWSGEELLTAEFDLLKANTEYAILGAVIQSGAFGAIRWRCSDFGNLGVGIPGESTFTELSSYFLLLSKDYELPLIPVFNSANKGSLLIDASTDENGADPIVSTILVELSPASGRR